MLVLNDTIRVSKIFASTSLIVVSMSAANAQSLLPSDPTVITGDIAFTLPSSGQLNITQSGTSGIINWGSFSIGSGNTVSIQNGSGATLNRVTGGDTSQILGTLDATGSVYLLNQNGVFIGEDGIIQTGGDFVASTLDVQNSDFLNQGDTVFKGGSDAGVLNFGKIGSLGGNVALIARTVVNEGSITAPNGTAALVAGREILMRDIALDNGMFVVRVGGEDTSVTDKGSIAAATAELRANGGNIYALAGNTSGTIRATGVKKKGGRIFLTAGGGAIKTTKTIAARRGSGSGGDIIVNAANIEASNLYDASASSGKGGFVELFATAEAAFSGTILAYGDDVPGMGGFAEVSGIKKLAFTGLADTGGGTLLLDPDNIEIVSDATSLNGASQIDPTTLIGNLALGNVIVETTGVDGEAGTILVSESLEYGSAFSLSLLAQGDVVLQAPVLNTSTGDINLVGGWDGSTGIAAFDSSAFDNADIFNPVIFGNDNGTAYTISGGNFTGSGRVRFTPLFGEVFVGSVGGSTRVYANDIDMLPIEDSGFSNGTMIGVRIDNSLFDGSTPITGDITVRAAGSINLSGGLQEAGSAQIGHVGTGFAASGGINVGDASGDILVEAGENIIFDAGEANGAYSMIGHGSVDTCAPATCTQSTGTRQGDITVFAGGEISLDDGLNSGDSPPIPILAWIGHGTGTTNGITNSDIVVEASSFDDNAFTSIPNGGTGVLNEDIITAGLAGGAFTLSATDTGLAFGNNTDISATDGDLVISTDGTLQFGSGSQISDAGSNGQYALSAGGTFFGLPGADLFDIGSGRWIVYSTRPDEGTGGLNAIDGLRPEVIAYGRSIDLDDPFLSGLSSVGPNDNVLVYSVDPQLTVDPISYTYGQDASVVPTYNFTVNGVEENPDDFGFINLRFTPDPGVVSVSPGGFVNAGSYTDGVITEFDAVGGASVSVGLGFATSSDLLVTPETLTVLLDDEVKETGTGYTGLVSYTGFVTGEDDSLITGGPIFSYTGNDGSEGITPGDYDVSGSGSTESSGNYVFDESDMASLTIIEGENPEPEGPGPTEEEPTADIPELPRDQNPSSINNREITAPILVNGTDGSNSEGFLEVSNFNTDQLVNQLQRGKQFCEGLAQSEYIIDCMGDSLQKAADGLPEGGDYAAVRAALEDASAKLAALARQNASTTLTRGLVQANGQQSSRRFTPVATEALAALNAQASAIIEEAQTVLLRSAQNSERRKIHYQRIAEAVGSNKILLRS